MLLCVQTDIWMPVTKAIVREGVVRYLFITWRVQNKYDCKYWQRYVKVVCHWITDIIGLTLILPSSSLRQCHRNLKNGFSINELLKMVNIGTKNCWPHGNKFISTLNFELGTLGNISWIFMKTNDLCGLSVSAENVPRLQFTCIRDWLPLISFKFIGSSRKIPTTLVLWL